MTNTMGWTPLVRKKIENPKHGSHLFPPKCAACGLSMRIKRREAHPERGPKFELQTYVCARCGQTEKRDAATPGAV